MTKVYVAKYFTKYYPEDNEIIGIFYDENKATCAIQDRISCYEPGRNESNAYNYSIEAIEITE